MSNTLKIEPKEEQMNFRLSRRVRDRLERVVKAKEIRMADFMRQAVLRAIEQAERQGIGAGSEGGEQ